MIRRFPIILMMWLLLTVPAEATTPLDYTRMILQQAGTIVAGNLTHDEKLAALSFLFGGFLDADAIGRDALGQHWASFNPAQQREFLSLFRELIQRAYVQDLLLFQNPDFMYAGQRLIDGGAVVDTKIVTPKDEFDVKYALVPAGDKWMATAITVEGVNLTENYGNQFNRALSQMTVDDLLTLMKRKFGNPGSGT
jgi:phospholipid transport system substrate-binding protein